MLIWKNLCLGWKVASKSNMKEIKDNQTVSVIVPVYNAMPYLKECLLSIKQQDYSDIEVIFIDDGSTDDSLVYLKEQAKFDTRIKIIHQENKGASAARNRGLEEAGGKWLAFVDADDVITKDYLSYLLDLTQKYDCRVSSCGYETQMTDGTIILGEQMEKSIIEIEKEKNEFYPIPYTVWHLLISNEVVQQYNIRFDESITYLEDVLFVYDVLFKVGKYCNGKKIGYRRNDHADSLTNVRYKKKNFEKWLSALKARYIICQTTKEYPALFANAVYEMAFFCNEIKILYKDILKEKPEKNEEINNYLTYAKKEVFGISNKQLKKKCLTVGCLYFSKLFFAIKGTTVKGKLE